MANVTYMASLRQGGKAAPGSRRVTVTLCEADFEPLRASAYQQNQTIGGTAADLIRMGLKAAPQLSDAIAEQGTRQ